MNRSTMRPPPAGAKVLVDNLIEQYAQSLKERTANEIVTLVHARVASAEHRRLFEVERKDMQHRELVRLAAKVLVRCHHRSPR